MASGLRFFAPLDGCDSERDQPTPSRGSLRAQSRLPARHLVAGCRVILGQAQHWACGM